MEAADEILVAAQEQRRHLLDEAAEEARRAAFEAAMQAQRSVWTCALASIEALEDERQKLLTQAEPMLVEMTRGAMEHLLLDVPPDWPSRSSARLVLKQLASLGDASRQAQLRVHPDDLGAVLPALEHLGAALVKADDSLAPGQCLLSAGHVQLRASYEGSVDTILAAVADVAKSRAAVRAPATNSDIQ